MTSTTSTSSTADPQNYVTNPPSTFCKIYNVQSKPELNHQYGLIVSYDNNKQRYMIVLCQNQNQIIALKINNLHIITKMNIRDTIMSQYQMIRYNIQIQQQIQMIQHYILQSILVPLFHTLHIPFTPQLHYFYIMICLIVFVLWYIIGSTKLLIVLTLTLVLLSLIGSDLLQGKPQSIRQLFFQTLPQQYTNWIQKELPFQIGSIIVKKPWLLRTFTSLLLFLIAYTLFGTPTHSRYFHTTSTSSSTSSTTRRPVSSSWMSSSISSIWNNNNHNSSNTIPSQMSKKNQEYYYQLGFNDATQQLEYGTSLIKTRAEMILDDPNNNGTSITVVVVNEDGTTSSRSSSAVTMDDPYSWKNTPDTTTTGSTTPKKTRYDNDPRIQDDHHDFDYYPTKSTTTSPKKSSSPFSFSTLMAIFTIYRIIQPIVMMSIQHDHHFNIQQFMIHLQTQMNPWKIMIVLFSLYRIIMAFM